MEENGDETTQELHFFYDAQSKPIFVEVEGVKYRYIYNLQGDVISIVDTVGKAVIEYEYDVWGKCIKIESEMLAWEMLNPFRYRSYVYDPEIECFYLRSRYYFVRTGRFINSDTEIISGNDFASMNVFTYCANEPIRNCDPTGRRYIIGTSVQAETAEERKTAIKSTKERAAITLINTLYSKGPVVVDSTVALKTAHMGLLQALHYERNSKQPEFPAVFDPVYFAGWDDTVPADCHQFSSSDRTNVKYVCPDGCCEAIYDSTGKLVTDPRDVGTYNYFPSTESVVGHAVLDVLPWILWGNTIDDPTTPIERIFGMLGWG